MKSKTQEKILNHISMKRKHYDDIEELIKSDKVINVMSEDPTKELHKYLKKCDIVESNRITLITKAPLNEIVSPKLYEKIKENLEDTNMGFIPMYNQKKGPDNEDVIGYMYINRFYYIDEQRIKIDIIEGLIAITPNSSIDNSDFDRFSPEQIAEMQEHIKDAYNDNDYYEHFSEMVQDMTDIRIRDFIQNSNIL